jgi:hypothetical protein
MTAKNALCTLLYILSSCIITALVFDDTLDNKALYKIYNKKGIPFKCINHSVKYVFLLHSTDLLNFQ